MRLLPSFLLLLLAASVRAQTTNPAPLPLPTPEARDKALTYLESARVALGDAQSPLADDVRRDIATAQASLMMTDAMDRTLEAIQTPATKLYALRDVSLAFYRIGCTSQQQRTLNAARALLRPDPNDAPDLAKIDLSFHQSAIADTALSEGDLAVADDVAKAMDASSVKADLLSMLAEAHAKRDGPAAAAPYFQQAIAALQGAESWRVHEGMTIIVCAQCRAGDDEAALRTATGLDLPTRLTCLAAICRTQAERGNTASVRAAQTNLLAFQQLLRANTGAHLDDQCVGDLAIALHKTTEQPLVLRILAARESEILALPDTEPAKIRRLVLFSTTQREAGDPSGADHSLAAALQCARKNTDPPKRIDCLCMIAQAQARQEEPLLARDTLLATITEDTTANPQEIARTASVIAEALFRKDGPTANLAWIEKLPTKELRASAYAIAAASLLRPPAK